MEFIETLRSLQARKTPTNLMRVIEWSLLPRRELRSGGPGRFELGGWVQLILRFNLNMKQTN